MPAAPDQKDPGAARSEPAGPRAGTPSRGRTPPRQGADAVVRMGQKAPEFRARAYHAGEFKDLVREDFKG